MTSKENTIDYEALRRKHGNRNRKIIMDKLRNQSYLYGISKDIGLTRSTIYYHVKELMKDGLVEKTGESNKKKYFKLKPLGKEVLDKMNLPER